MRQLFTDTEWESIGEVLRDGSSFFEAETQEEIINVHIAPTPVCRAAWCERAIETAVRTGTRQLVILGAGLDTFALRQPSFVRDLPIYEVDPESTQQDKIERIECARLTIPKNLRFVSTDFRTEDTSQALLRADFDPSQKTFFSCMGVSYYLFKEEFEQLLSTIASICAEGSAFAFDAADEGLFDAQETRVRKMLALAIGGGEPMKSCFSEAELTRMLSRQRFLMYECLSPSDIQRQLIGADRSMKAFEHIRYILAVHK